MNNETAAPAGYDLRWVSPSEISSAGNVRSADLTNGPAQEALAQSIARNGVLTPLRCVEATTGLLVIDGHRRLAAARAAGLESVPVFVVPDAQSAAVRVIEQLVTNDQREALTQTDRLRAYEQLELEGLTADTIARRVSRPKKEIQAALKVTASPQLMHSIETTGAGELDLVECAELAELADVLLPSDLDMFTRRLAASPGRSRHWIQSAKDTAQRIQDRARLEDRLRSEGKTVVSSDDLESVNGLSIGPASPFIGLPEEHAACGCAGEAWVVLRTYDYGIQDWTLTAYRCCTKWDSCPLNTTGFANEASREKQAQAAAALAAERAAWTEWGSACKVRRAWIREQLQSRKRPPSAIEMSIAVLPDPEDFLYIEGLLSEKWCQTWLGRPREAALADTKQLRMIFELLPLLAAAQLDLRSWQLRDLAKAKTSQAYVHENVFLTYRLLHALESWGYPLAEAERAFISDVQAAQKRAEEE